MKKKEKKTLNPNQEKFCQLYASDEEFFGNGVKSYLQVYGYQTEEGRKCTYDTAKANASRLLTKAYILKRINELFEARGLNDTFVDKQLEKLITQDADFKSKLGAIKEYNALKSRITQKIDHTTKGEKIMPYSNEQQQLIAQRILKDNGTEGKK